MGRAEIEGRVAGVYVAPFRDKLVSIPFSPVQVRMEGFVGDRHSGLSRRSGVRERQIYSKTRYPEGAEIKNSRQISIVSEEELAEIAESMQIRTVRPEWLGANLMLRDIPDLTHLPLSTRLVFPQEATLVVDSENLPCIHPGNVIAENDQRADATVFVSAAFGKRGLVAWVEKEGEIFEDDTVRLVIPPQRTYSIPQPY
jgi:MOSC domain-containing protein YiiM